MDIIERNCIEYAENQIIYRNLMNLMINTDDRIKFFEILSVYYKGKIDVIAGIDPNGYLFTLLAHILNIPFLPIRKRDGKVPNTSFKYYNSNNESVCLEVQMDLLNKLPKSSRILVIDDILTTGESILSCIYILKQHGYRVTNIMCPIELLELNGRNKLSEYDFISFYKIPYNNTQIMELEYKLQDCKKLKNSGLDYLNNEIIRLESEIEEKNKSPNNISIKKIKYEYTPTIDDDRIILFYHYDMESIAKSIANEYPNHFRLGKINWNYFPDTWYNISFESPINNKNVVFLATLYDPKKFLESAMLSVIFPKQHIKSFSFIIPYFAPATFERVQSEGTLASAEPVAKLITSCLRDTKTESSILKIYDIHALPVKFYFTDNCIVKHLSAIPLIKNIIKKDMLTICFADEGAVKRFKHYFIEFPMIICSKERVGIERKIIISDKYNFNNDKNMEHVIIIDDLVQTGNTLHECRKALQQYGFKKVSCFVTHAVFPNECYNDFYLNGAKSGFENFYVTNTNPMVTDKLIARPFIVLNINNHLAEDILEDLQIKKENNYSELNVVVSSLNKHELRAVNITLNKINSLLKYRYYPINIYAVDSEYKSNNQLFEIDEITEGVESRLYQLYDMYKDPDTLYISIDSGYCTVNEGYEYASVLIYYKGKRYEEQSDGIYIDSKDSDIIDKSRIDRSITIGSRIEERYGYPEGEWHEYYSNISRTQQLCKPLMALLSSIFKKEFV